MEKEKEMIVCVTEWHILFELQTASFFLTAGSAPSLSLHRYSAFRQKYLSSAGWLPPPPFPPQR